MVVADHNPESTKRCRRYADSELRDVAFQKRADVIVEPQAGRCIGIGQERTWIPAAQPVGSPRCVRGFADVKGCKIVKRYATGEAVGGCERRARSCGFSRSKGWSGFNIAARVVLPHCLGPRSAVMGARATASRRRASSR